MTILAGDIKLVASKVMDDVPEGGGGPTSVLIVDGQSNNIFQDISEFDRAGGKVSLRKLHVSVQTDNTDTYLGSNIIVSDPPNDPNVSITVFSTRSTFDTREEAQNRIESYLVRGPAWNGFLFERHVAGQRSIQLCQRPNTATPPIGRTLCLISGEDTPQEFLQYVRVTRIGSENRLFYDVDTNADFQAQIVTCEISDALRYDFMGTNAFRTFLAGADRTIVRDTTVADAATYTGVVALKNPASIGDLSIGAVSIYTQLVPSSRTEAITLDAKPASQRTTTLASAPRRVEVSLTPHSMRIRVGQENRGFSWVQMLRPLPSPNTVVVSFRALGTWYTLVDDGLGILSGSGVGTVNYLTGSISLTLPSLPDVGSSIIFSWGENTAYTSRAGQAGYRAPEFAYAVPHQALKPGSIAVTWESGGVTKTLTDDSAGLLTGDGSGQVNYASGKLYVKPTAMIDAGGEFSTAYTYTSLITKNVPAPSVDAGGFANIVLDDVPFPKTITVKWVTIRNVTASGGASELSKTTSAGQETVTVATPPQTQSALGIRPSATSVLGGGTVTYTYNAATPAPVGTYTYQIQANSLAANDFLSGSFIGSFTVAAAGTGLVSGSFQLAMAPDSGFGDYSVKVFNPSLVAVGLSNSVSVMEFPAALTSIPPHMPQAGIKVKSPLSSSLQVFDGKTEAVVAGMYIGGQKASGERIYVGVYAAESPLYGFYYDPPARQDEVWSAAEVTASVKNMMSLNGVVREYPIWAGTSFVPSYQYMYASSGG